MGREDAIKGTIPLFSPFHMRWGARQHDEEEDQHDADPTAAAQASQ
jgi:hypothetical protein